MTTRSRRSASRAATHHRELGQSGAVQGVDRGSDEVERHRQLRDEQRLGAEPRHRRAATTRAPAGRSRSRRADRSSRPSTSRSSTTPPSRPTPSRFVFTATNPGNAQTRHGAGHDRRQRDPPAGDLDRRLAGGRGRHRLEDDGVHRLARPGVDRTGHRPVLDRQRHRHRAGIRLHARRTTSRSSSRPARLSKTITVPDLRRHRQRGQRDVHGRPVAELRRRARRRDRHGHDPQRRRPSVACR